MRHSILAVLSLAAAPPAVIADDPPAERPITGADTVLAVFSTDMGLRAGPPFKKPVVVIWPDGKAVWSRDRVVGGPPYFEGRADPKAVASLLDRLDQDGLFADKSLTQAHVPPDYLFNTVLVRSGKKRVKMESSHEFAEQFPGGVYSHVGVSDLPPGVRRLDALRKGPAEWLYYRMVWAETRGKIADLLPAEGKPSVGAPDERPEGLFWRDRADPPAKK